MLAIHLSPQTKTRNLSENHPKPAQNNGQQTKQTQLERKKMDDGALAVLVLGGICFLLLGFIKWLFSGPWTSGETYAPPDSWVVYHRPTYLPPVVVVQPVVVEYHLPPARIVRRSRWNEVVGNDRVQRDETVEWAAPPQVEYEDAEWREVPRAVLSSRKILPRPE